MHDQPLLLGSLLLACLAAPLAAQSQGLKLANGTVNYIDVPYSPSLMPRGITIEAWVTYDSSTLGTGYRYPTIVRGDPTPNQSSYFLRVEAGNTLNNQINFWVTTPSGNYTLRWTFTAGQLLAWTHLAATYDGTALRIIVNGVQVAQGVATGPIVDKGQGVRIGSADLTVVGGETWNGEIDELRIWPYARSAAAIAATMKQQLGLMPGEVTTWNFTGNAQDSSGTNHGTVIGASPFAANTLALTNVPFPGSVAFGTGSGCAKTALAGLNSLANVGNSAFGLVCQRAPASANGLLAISAARLAAAFPILGVDLWVDFGAPSLTVPTAASTIGAGNVGLPVPSTPALIGAAVFGQWFWADASCPSGLTASNALAASVMQ